MSKRKSRPSATQRNIPVERYLPENLVTNFSDGITVQHTKHEFIITFYQLEHPPAVSEEDLAALRKIKAKAVDRIVLTPAGMASLAEVVNKNLQRYIDNYGEAEVAEKEPDTETVGTDVSFAETEAK